MRYDKLVRDKIPEIIEQGGKTATFRILNDDAEFKYYLEQKLDEEVAEFHESKNAEELADILEVLVALIKVSGYDPRDITKLRKIKAARRGTFEERVFLIETK